MILRFVYFSFFVSIVLYSGQKAYAADYTHGEACSTSGAWHQTNDSSGMDFLVCDGAAWKSALYFSSTGNNIRLDDDPTGDSLAGCIRFSAAGGGALQYSHDCATYSDFGAGGDSLWLENGSNIYYNSGAVLINKTSPDTNEVLSVENTDFWNNSGVLEYAAKVNAWSGGTTAANNSTYGVSIYSENAGEGAGNTAIAIDAFAATANDSTTQSAYGINALTETHTNDAGYGIYLSNSSASTGGTMYGLYINLQDTDVTRYGIYQNTSNDNYLAGSLGIGKDDPGVALDVVGNINYTGEIVDVSDIRMKYDIEPLQSPLAKLTTLSGFSFKMKGDDSRNIEYGVSAQDVQKVFPELVHEVDEDGTLGVSYNGLIAPMIEAIKEQQEQIESLNAEIESLKAIISDKPTKL